MWDRVRPLLFPLFMILAIGGLWMYARGADLDGSAGQRWRSPLPVDPATCIFPEPTPADFVGES